MRKVAFVNVEGILFDKLPMNRKTLDLVFFLMSGGDISPIKLEKTKNGYKVLDGRHRLAAFKLLGEKMILAKFYEPQNLII